LGHCSGGFSHGSKGSMELPFCQTNLSKQPHNSTKHSDQFYFSKLALDIVSKLQICVIIGKSFNIIVLFRLFSLQPFCAGFFAYRTVSQQPQNAPKCVSEHQFFKNFLGGSMPPRPSLEKAAYAPAAFGGIVGFAQTAIQKITG